MKEHVTTHSPIEPSASDTQTDILIVIMWLSGSQIIQLIASIFREPRTAFWLWRKGLIRIQIGFRDFLPGIIFETYDDFTIQKDLELAVLRNETDSENFILAALQAAKGCRFVIFQTCPEQFLQFWIEDGACLLSYPLAKENTHRQHLKKFLELFNELQFKKLPQRKGYDPAPEHYMINRHGNYTDYLINFGTVSPRVSEFANRVFTEVFEDDLVNLRANVG